MKSKIVNYIELLIINVLISDVLSNRIRPMPQYESKHQINGPVYAIIFPGKISPNSDYLLTVSTDGLKEDITLSIEISGFSNDFKIVNYDLTETIKANETQIMTSKIGDLTNHRHCLMNIYGKGGVSFNYTQIRLNVHYKQDIVLIQTDKAIYKPRQIVKMRVVVIDANLRPISERSVITTVQDGKGNVIKRFKGVTKNGIVAHELQLSEEPVLGNWRISVSHEKNKYSVHGANKLFEVAQYVLPSFDVKLIVPKVVTITSTEVLVTVSASYTYSKTVQGDLRLFLQDGNYVEYINNTAVRRINYELRAKFNGEITVELPISVFNLNRYNYAHTFYLLAVVRDELTGRTYNKTQLLTVYKHAYSFMLMNPKRSFKPGVSYRATIKVSTRDGRPVENNGPPIKVIYGFGWDEKIMKREVTGVPVNGFLVVDIDTTFTKKEPLIFTERVTKSRKSYIYYRKVYPIKRDNKNIVLFIKYRNITENIGYIYEEMRPSDGCHLKIKQNNFLTEVAKVKDVLSLSVTLGTPLKQFVYEVITSKGVIKNEIVIPGGLEHNISMELNASMIPQTRVVVYALCNKTLIADNVDIPIEPNFKNDVKIATNINETIPGSSIDVTVETKSNSTVALLAVDIQTVLLRTGNDIGKVDVDKAMQRNIGCNNSPYYASCTYSSIRGHFGINPHPIQNSGLLVVSNIRYQYYYNYNYAASTAFAGRRMMNKHSMVGGGASMAAGAEMAVMRTRSTDGMQAADSIDHQIRKYFPETWIWEIIDSGETGKLTFTRKVPDTITSWYLSAFALSKETGIGFTENKISVTVFKHFFAKAILPYSVIRGETISIQVNSFNYLKKQIVAKITISNEKNEFDIVDKSGGIQSVQLDADEGKSVSFIVKPKKVGYIDIKIIANAGEAGDVIVEKLLVEAEGTMKHVNHAMLITFNENKTFIKQVDIEIPLNAVPDSEHVKVTAIGDILGPAITHLEDLLRMPYGCGEQNMINLVPNILVLHYLSNTGRLTDKIKKKALSHIDTGYQRQLTYGHSDGSYSAFGNTDRFGSTWLTAFVLKTFAQMHPYFDIIWNKYHSSANFLRSKQQRDGSFIESGQVIHTEMQSKSGKSVALTAYVITAISVHPHASRNLINKSRAQDYLENAIKSTSDAYKIAIITYALHLLNSNEKDTAFNKLMNISKKDNEFVYWKSNDNSNFASIEMTSYALLTLLARRQTQEALPIVKWLISKQNSRGGFTSTQDTVISLEALAKFAKTVKASDNNISVTISANDFEPKTLEINKENAIVLQDVLLPKTAKTVKIIATGNGVCVAQVSFRYNVLKSNTTKKAAFVITYSLMLSNEVNGGFEMNVCTKYINGKQSGMALMEVQLPSGFVFDSDSVQRLKSGVVKRVETSKSNTLITLYFEKITETETCIQISAVCEVEVTNLKPAPITVYDYYDTSKRNTVFYDLTPKPPTAPPIIQPTSADTTTAQSTIAAATVVETAATTTMSRPVVKDN